MPIQLAAKDSRNLAKVYTTNQSYTDPSDIAMLTAINLLVDFTSSIPATPMVANLGALATLDASGIPEGTLVYVGILHSYFYLDKASSLTPDGITIITAFNGGASAQWLRTTFSSILWTYTSNWEIDSVNGNDQAFGTSGLPIKTFAELWRRLGYGSVAFIPQNITITTIGDFANTDPLRLNLRLGPGVYILVRPLGFSAQTSTGTVSAHVNLARPTLASITGAAGIASFVGQLCVMEGGADDGKKFWLERDMGANQIETSPPVTAPVIPFSGVPTLTTIANGSTYSTYTLPRIDDVEVNITAEASTVLAASNSQIYFMNYDFSRNSITNTVGPSLVTGRPAITTVFLNCIIGGSMICPTGNVVTYSNCKLAPGTFGITFTYGKHFVSAGMTLGVSTGTLFCDAGSFVRFDLDHVVQLSRLRTGRGATLQIGTLCIQNSTGDALTCESDAGVTRILTVSAGAHLLYGTGNTGVGILMGSGRSLYYQTTKPTVTGAVGDTKIGSVAVTAYAAVPFVFFAASPDNGAQITVTF